jgi:hypothetical protein
MWIKRKSAITGIEHTLNIPVDPADMIKWKNGIGTIDEVIPYLSEMDCAFILSGITPNEWANAFKKEEITEGV